MSWNEYSDMYENAQNTGKYRCFVFDMVGSREGYDEKKLELLTKILKKRVKKYCIEETEEFPEMPGIILGDMIYVAIPKYEVSDEEILEHFKYAKDNSEINKEFHYAIGNYETNKWVDGGEKYYLGYCIRELEAKSKVNRKIVGKSLT